MANAFTATRAFRYGGPNSKQLLEVEGVFVVDTTANAGALDGDNPASLFGLQEIIGTAAITLSTNAKVYVGVPSYDADSLMVVGGAANVPMNLPNGTYKVCVRGYSA